MMNLPNRAKILAAGGALIVAVSIGAWLFSHSENSAEYSLKMISESVENHDREKFEKYVDTVKIVDDATDALIAEMIPAERASFHEPDIAKILKPPLVSGFSSIIDDYIKSGEWCSSSLSEDYARLLAKTGLKNIEFRGANVESESGKEALVAVKVFQPEISAEYPLIVKFKKNNDVWRAEEVSGFRDFIAEIMNARRSKFHFYMEKTAEIFHEQEKISADAERQLDEILGGGNIGDAPVRDKMKRIVDGEVLPGWRKVLNELSGFDPPEGAKALHHLRIRIAKMRISQAEVYADWLETKKAESIHKSNELLREIRTLEEEERMILKSIRSKNLL